MINTPITMNVILYDEFCDILNKKTYPKILKKWKRNLIYKRKKYA